MNSEKRIHESPLLKRKNKWNEAPAKKRTEENDSEEEIVEKVDTIRNKHDKKIDKG